MANSGKEIQGPGEERTIGVGDILKAFKSKGKKEADLKVQVPQEVDNSEKLAEARERIQKLAEKSQNALQQAPEKVSGAVEWSRKSRIRTAENNSQKNVVQRVLSKGVGGWLLRTGLQALPSPVGYGPGDLITGASAVLGVDILTGEKLDVVDRVLFGVATVIPGVPATVIVGPARLIRHGIEEAVHEHNKGNDGAAVNHMNVAARAASELKNGVKNSRKK